MKKDIERIMFSEEQLAERIAQMGAQLTKDFDGKDPLIVCVLKGASVFCIDLIRKIECPVQLDFIAASSYGNGSKSSGKVQIVKDVSNKMEGRDVLIVEDIVDSGNTLSALQKMFADRGANSVKICTLFDKPARRVAPVHVDYIGFEIEDEFIVGYGLDYAERYRNLPFVGVLKRSVYED